MRLWRDWRYVHFRQWNVVKWCPSGTVSGAVISYQNLWRCTACSDALCIRRKYTSRLLSGLHCGSYCRTIVCRFCRIICSGNIKTGKCCSKATMLHLTAFGDEPSRATSAEWEAVSSCGLFIAFARCACCCSCCALSPFHAARAIAMRCISAGVDGNFQSQS